MQFWLEFNFDGQNQRFDFDQGTVSIGRDQSSDFHLDHPTVSRQHALIVENQGSFQLVVLSRNGLTALDGRKVSGTVDLRHGQTLQLGEVQLGFRAPQTGGQAGPGFGDVATEHFSLSEVSEPSGTAPTAAMPPVEPETEPSRPAMDRAPLALGQASDVQTDAMKAVGGPSPFDQEAPTQENGLNPISSSTFGANGSQQGDPPPPANPSHPAVKDEDFGIQTWDEIAAQANTGGHEAVQAGPTDFERIQKAQAKAKKKSKGTSPLMIVLLVAGVGGIIALLLWEPGDGPKKVVEEKDDPCEDVIICYPEEKKPTCPNKEECVAQAIAAYEVADELYKRKAANITNLYEAYKQLDKADRFLEQAGVEKPPEEMKDYEERIEKYVAELDDIAKEHRIRHHQLAQRKMNWEMAENVRAWQQFFPDRRNKWWDEAIEAERQMKDRGSWPKKFDPKKKKKKRRR